MRTFLTAGEICQTRFALVALYQLTRIRDWKHHGRGSPQVAAAMGRTLSEFLPQSETDHRPRRGLAFA